MQTAAPSRIAPRSCPAVAMILCPYACGGPAGEWPIAPAPAGRSVHAAPPADGILVEVRPRAPGVGTVGVRRHDAWGARVEAETRNVEVAP